MKKLRVGILFGGRSGEHEVSLLSAASVLNAIDKNKFEVVPIGITKEGRWLTAADAELLLQGKAAGVRSQAHIPVTFAGRRSRSYPWSRRPGHRTGGRGPAGAAAARRNRWLLFRPRLLTRRGQRPRHQRGHHLSRAARNFWRRRNDSRIVRTCGHRLRGCRRAGFRRRHGQGRHEVIVHCRRTAHREARRFR